MKSRETIFRPVKLSLKDLLGGDYVERVCAAREGLLGEDAHEANRLAEEEVEFYPESLHERLIGLLPEVGESRCAGLKGSARGATSSAFAQNTKTAAAPLTGLGYLRVGEDGRLRFSSKCEHYHAPLGHAFPGFRLVEYARRLGVPNATHNNTRGHITRVLEEELVRTAAGLVRGDEAGLNGVLGSDSAGALNRVLNLETGSLAAEAALKMTLSRFYRAQADSPVAKYEGRIPVVLVLGDDYGEVTANYHGTTVLTQVLRGMWPRFREGLETRGLFVVRCVSPNDVDELERVFERYNEDPYHMAGFFHELILMNYGARRLSEAFVRRAYALCEKHDVPPVADEIQTGIWSPELYLFREYGVRPSIVVLGKGFPGGEYAASRVLFSADMDSLPQFGALVTNGQEELASLAYLVTMRWAEENAEVTRVVGDYYEERLADLAERYPETIHAIEGRRHLAGIFFHGVGVAKAFASRLNQGGFDISVQSYKEDCPPTALTKLPLTAGYEAVDFFVDRMDDALKAV